MQSIPFWRDVRILSILAQVAFLVLVVLAGSILYTNVVKGMEAANMSGDFDFMDRAAGFEILVKPIGYTPDNSYWYVFLVGLINTMSVSVVGIVLATVLGIVTGIAQLSSNWLVAKLAQAYVALFRNIPLLVQLVFWYQAVFLQMPNVRHAIELPGPVYLSKRGLVTLSPQATPTTASWFVFIVIGVLVGVALWYWLRRLQDRTGRQTPQFLIALACVLAGAGAGWVILTPAPLSVSVPTLQGFNFKGGLRLVPEYVALVLGLSIYTGAFISENVRAGIQGISKEQKDAARALGFSPGQSMRLVILPQALRIIIPPTTNQYLNLLKNSSLAIVIGFPDLFNIARTTANQTGQAIQVIGLVMVLYLAISLFTSFIMNVYNRSVRLVER